MTVAKLARLSDKAAWAELDGRGYVVRFRSITRTPDGTVTQDHVYENGSEQINYDGWNDTTLVCTGIMPDQTALPFDEFIDPTKLTAAGMSEKSNPADLAAAHVTGHGREFQALWPTTDAPFQAARKVALIDARTSQDLGTLLFGERADGSEVLLQSRVGSPIEPLNVVDASLFQMPTLPPCAHQPGSSAGT